MSNAILKDLADKEISVHLISNILPGRGLPYRLSATDGHPSELAHSLIADHVIRYIVDEQRI